MKLRMLLDLSREILQEWSDGKIPQKGAALAYYSVFSIVPVVIIAISVASLFLDEELAHSRIVREIAETMGQPAANTVQRMIKQAGQASQDPLTALVGFAILLFGASGVFVELQDALNTIWKVPPRPGWGIAQFFHERALSFAIVLGTGFLLLVSLVASAVLTAVSEWVTAPDLPGGLGLWQSVHTAVSLGLVTTLFALIYKILPDVHIAWRHVWAGALLAAILFTVGRYLIGLYLGKSGVASAFGAAGSIVLILVWVYYSAQIVLLGALFTRVYARHHGGRDGGTPFA